MELRLLKALVRFKNFTEEMMGMTLITHQTGSSGLPVNIVYIEPGSDIDRENLPKYFIGSRGRKNIILLPLLLVE